MPVRIQRKRTKGYRLPPGTVVVTRPTKWGNPFVPGKQSPTGSWPVDAIGAVCLFEAMLKDEQLRAACGYPSIDEIRRELRGKDLACYCPIGNSCHADVLLRLSNQ